MMTGGGSAIDPSGFTGDTTSQNKPDDYAEYIADMILELQRMARDAGREELAQRLFFAYEIARQPRLPDQPDKRSQSG